MSDNLALWNSVEKTPLDQTKPITGKSYSGTSPKPHYLIRKATETFGPCGIGWGFTIEDERIEEGAGGERMSIARVKVWYEWSGKRGEVEHIGGTSFSGTRASGKPFTDEDAPKKSVTDALIKALSMIGFAGDIFMGRYDDSKYVSELREEQRTTDQRSEQERRETAKSKADARPIYASLVEDMRKLTSKEDLRRWIADAEVKNLRSQLPADWDAKLRQEAAEYGNSLPAPDAPNKYKDLRMAG
jgi:hypothetical protein